MKTSLHNAVSALAGSQPGLVFSQGAFRGFLLNHFGRAIELLKNGSVPVEGFPAIEAKFNGLNVVSSNFNVSLSDKGGAVSAEITPGFQATIALHFAGDSRSEFSTIKIDVKHLRVGLTVNAPHLLIGEPDFDVRGEVVPSLATRNAAMALPKITEQDVLRVEGAMAYVMPRRLVTSVLSTIRGINLAEHFTALELRGDWALHVVNGALLVVPSGGIVIRPNLGCPLSDTVPDNLSTKPGPRETIDDTHYSWPITKAVIPHPVVKPAEDRLDGFASLYAPKSIWEEKFSKTMPAVVYRENGNAFIGYDLTFTASMKYAGLRIDPARFGIVVDLDFVANGFVYLTIDVPCVGRCDLAYVRFSCAPSQLSVLVSFVLSPPGKLLLESQIERLDIGQVDATVAVFARWLALAGGKAAVIGFIMDYLLKRVIEQVVPIKMRHAIRQEVNSRNFQLLDLDTLAIFALAERFNQVTFSGDVDSVLVGCGTLG
jgi:hypothetical protein